MAKVHPQLDAGLQQWIAQQKVFFVATAPLAGEGHINCSPRGGDFLRVRGALAGFPRRARQPGSLDLSQGPG